MQQLCIENCDQSAADSDMVTIDSLQKLVIALSIGNIADPLRRTIWPHYMRVTDRQTTDTVLYHRRATISLLFKS